MNANSETVKSQHSAAESAEKVLEHAQEYILTPIIVGVLSLALGQWILGVHHAIDELTETVPLSVSVAIIAYCITAKRFTSPQAGLLWSAALLAVAAGIAGVFNPLDVLDPLTRNQEAGATSWMELPFLLLGKYYDLYHPVNFWMAMAAGSFIGVRLGWPQRTRWQA